MVRLPGRGVANWLGFAVGCDGGFRVGWLGGMAVGWVGGIAVGWVSGRGTGASRRGEIGRRSRLAVRVDVPVLVEVEVTVMVAMEELKTVVVAVAMGETAGLVTVTVVWAWAKVAIRMSTAWIMVFSWVKVRFYRGNWSKAGAMTPLLRPRIASHCFAAAKLKAAPAGWPLGLG